MLCHLFNPISWGAQTITPLTFHSGSIPETLCPNPLSINTYHVGHSLVSGAGQPTRHFNSEDGCPISEGTIRKRLKRSFTTGIRCFSYFSPAWLTARLCWSFILVFVLLNTHLSLAERTADKACVLRERLRARLNRCTCLFSCQTTQCNYFGSLCQPIPWIRPCFFLCVCVDFYSS